MVYSLSGLSASVQIGHVSHLNLRFVCQVALMSKDAVWLPVPWQDTVVVFQAGGQCSACGVGMNP